MFDPYTIYHVYNQSINYELLFRSGDNYRFFLKKCRTHLLPYACILCYCLMPDHFHFLLKPTLLGCQPSRSGRFLRREEEGLEIAYQQNLSNAIRIMLSSYTQAINKEYRRRGGLFKAKTKAKPGYHNFYPDIHLVDGRPFTHFIPYLKTCFHYIHDNPTKADLVVEPVDWEFSSALDYAGYRDSRICDFALTEELLGIKRSTPPGGTDWARTG